MQAFVTNKAKPQDSDTPEEDKILPRAHFPKNIFKYVSYCSTMKPAHIQQALCRAGRFQE